MIMGIITRWEERAKHLKTQTYAIYLASRNPRVPWFAKLLIILVVAHTFSPIDLIPDFIPVLGLLDDLIIAPLGIALAIRMVPPDVMAECYRQAKAGIGQDRPMGWVAAVVIIAIWLLVAALVVTLLYRVIQG